MYICKTLNFKTLLNYSVQIKIINRPSVDIKQTLPLHNDSLKLPVIFINEQKQAPNLDKCLPISIVIEPKTTTVTDYYHLVSKTSYEYQSLIQTWNKKNLVNSNVTKNKPIRDMSLDSRLKMVESSLNCEFFIPLII